MDRLTGRTVLLTGGSRGIGPVIARALAERGADLALAARSETGLDEAAARLEELGVRTLTVPVDLRHQSERERLVAHVVRELGKIDILVNNAALETEGAYVDLPWASVQETIEVNLAAPMSLTRLVLPAMLERGSGCVVNIASLAAKGAAPYDAAYSGTKAGLAAWSRAMRLELAGTGVSFSTVFPGYVMEAGMFAKFGLRPPWLVGSCNPSHVAEAVLAVVDRGLKEKIVNSRPVRYAFMLDALSPALGDWLMRVSGVVSFQRRKVGK